MLALPSHGLARIVSWEALRHVGTASTICATGHASSSVFPCRLSGREPAVSTREPGTEPPAGPRYIDEPHVGPAGGSVPGWVDILPKCPYPCP